MIIDAARRRAKVQLLLDGFFDEPEANRSNQATVEYLTAIATAEGLDIVGAVGNPTGGGIHAKWLLARVDGVTWSAVGSLNRGEISYKVNCPAILVIALDTPKLGRDRSQPVAPRQFIESLAQSTQVRCC
ncbi:MAG: hypothetical protein IT328_19830 [Caldilineaceae bacterium]|nr:hypothetical protein [Caldilineaceae bacterium]